MSGHMVDDDAQIGAGASLPPWEALVVDTVGNVIEFWGFKRNQGRVWALLYVRDAALDAQELQDELGLSKGAVSMIVRELEGWSVLRRVRRPGDAVWRFEAETNLMRMVGKVFRERESSFLARVVDDLTRAEELARKDRRVPREVVARIGRMKALAQMVDGAVRLFVDTAKFDVGPALRLLASVRK